MGSSPGLIMCILFLVGLVNHRCRKISLWLRLVVEEAVVYMIIKYYSTWRPSNLTLSDILSLVCALTFGATRVKRNCYHTIIK